MDYERLQNVIEDLCKQKGVKKAKALEDSGVGKNFFWNAIKRGSVPSVDKLQALAVYFGVSLDYLVGNTDVPEVNRAEETMSVAALRAISALPPDEQAKVIEYAQLLAKKDMKE